MKKTIQSRREFRKHTTGLELVVDNTLPTSGSSLSSNVLVLNAPPPDGFTSMSDFVAELEATPETSKQLAEGRRWIGEKFYSNSGDTIRSLRLAKGWSQATMAEKLATSQSHVARIEKGTENLARSTLRSLCAVLDIDMNTLDAALTRQEESLQRD